MSEKIQQEARGSTKLALKAGLWYVISNFLVRSMSFLTTPIFTRLLSTEQYGEFSNFASWLTLLVIVAGAELHNTLNRAYYDFKEDFNQYVSTVTVASCLLTAVMYGLFLLCGKWIYTIVNIPPAYVHILFFMMMCQSCKTIFVARERTLYRYKTVAALSVFIVAVPTLIAVALVSALPEAQRLDARIYGTYVPMALVGLMCGMILIKQGKRFNTKYLKYAFTLALPLLLHYLTAHLLTSSDAIITKAVLGAEAVSVVSVATSVNHIVTILLQSVSGALMTWLMDNMEQNKEKAVRRGTFLYVGGIMLVTLAVIFVAPEIVWVLGGSKYAASAYLLPGMAVAAMVQSSTTVFTIMLTYKKKVAGTAVYTAAVSVLCIVAKIWLLPIFGVQCIPYVNMAAFAVLFLVNYLLVCKAGCKKMISIKGMLIVLAIAFAVMLLSPVLYAANTVRYSVIGVCFVAVCIAAYIKRDMVKTLLQKMLKKKKTAGTK